MTTALKFPNINNKQEFGTLLLHTYVYQFQNLQIRVNDTLI